MTGAGDDGETIRAAERQKSVPGGLDETTSLEGDVEKEFRMVNS